MRDYLRELNRINKTTWGFLYFQIALLIIVGIIYLLFYK